VDGVVGAVLSMDMDVEREARDRMKSGTRNYVQELALPTKSLLLANVKYG
jgi:hypothetical protein